MVLPGCTGSGTHTEAAHQSRTSCNPKLDRERLFRFSSCIARTCLWLSLSVSLSLSVCLCLSLSLSLSLSLCLSLSLALGALSLCLLLSFSVATRTEVQAGLARTGKGLERGFIVVSTVDLFAIVQLSRSRSCRSGSPLSNFVRCLYRLGSREPLEIIRNAMEWFERRIDDGVVWTRLKTR